MIRDHGENKSITTAKTVNVFKRSNKSELKERGRPKTLPAKKNGGAGRLDSQIYLDSSTPRKDAKGPKD